MNEILTPEEMYKADQYGASRNQNGSYGLMLRAGEALGREILGRYGNALGLDILCGPGNNGGDGYVLATFLHAHGLKVRTWRGAEPLQNTDGWRAASECVVEKLALDGFQPQPGYIVVDALFGAGLVRPLTGIYAEIVERIANANVKTVAVDLPSGVSGESGMVLGCAASAELTITFFRKKPGHLLYPGRALCGEIVVADIGIPDSVLTAIAPRCRENTPADWNHLLPKPTLDAHKYRRGHVGVFSGPAHGTGAARLSAMAAARIGAGAVTMLSPASALAVNAHHLTSIMLRPVDGEDELAAFLDERKPAALVLGPGFGVSENLRQFAELTLRFTGSQQERPSLVLDADALTAFSENSGRLFDAVQAKGGGVVLTPHEGEFARLFPDLANDSSISKLQRARQASARSHAVIVYKGPDTIVACPEGMAVINTNGTPYLATAGSGDVLAGMIAGLMAQGMSSFAASCAAVYLHAETGRRVGPGLIAEDLPDRLPAVLAFYLDRTQ